MIRYVAELRCPAKVNGIQRHSKQREKFDERRAALQKRLSELYPRPAPIGVPVMLYAAFFFRDGRHGDVFAYMDGLADSISVGKTTINRRLKTVQHLFPVLEDDSLILAPTFFPEYGRCIMPDCGKDIVEFAVVPC